MVMASSARRPGEGPARRVLGAGWPSLRQLVPLKGTLRGEKQDVCGRLMFSLLPLMSAALRRGLSVLHRLKLGLT